MKKGWIITISVVSVIIFIVVLAMILAWTGILTASRDDDNVAYRVLQITDVHILNDAAKDQKALDTITKTIEKAEPNMIIVTGDITSENENLLAFTTFGTFMEGFKIPWAVTYGNHDAEEVRLHEKSELSAYLETLEYCIFEKGPDDVKGEGNYYYNVEHDGRVIMSLIMMDSNMNYQKEDGQWDGYDNFADNQVEWYKETVREIATNVNGDSTKVVPSLAFFHIPMMEYATGYEEAQKNGDVLYGYKLEGVYSSNYEDQMFEAMVEMGSTKGMYVGHDHMNSTAFVNNGIRMTYGYSSDHNIYLTPQKGGTLINIKKDGTFTQQGIYCNLGVGEAMFGKAV